MRKQKKISLEDGCNSELVETAKFDGILEMPAIEPPDEIIIPKGMIPFSERKRTKDFSELVVCYEMDVLFGDLIASPATYVEELLKFAGFASPDCSLYRNMPLMAQLINIYRNRAVGYYLQSRGVYVIPNIRWGDERTYTNEFLPEKAAFLGVPKNSILSVGTYGCFEGKENKYYFEAGFAAMLETLIPKIVLVYGTMPDNIFSKYKKDVQLIAYPDWITFKHSEKEVL